MKKKTFGKLLMIALATILVFGAASVAMASGTDDFAITSLKKGSPLFTIDEVPHSYGDDDAGIGVNAFTSGSSFTCRVYKSSDHSTHIMDYMIVATPYSFQSEEFYTAYKYITYDYDCQMKFSNETNYPVAVTGWWAIRA